MSSRAWAMFAAVSLLWGIPYLFIKVALDDGVPPGFVAFARVALAAVATGSRLVGLFVGLSGVVALVGVDVAGSGRELAGAAAVGLAACGYAAGPMILKRHLADLDARATMGASLAIAAVLLAPLAALDPPTAAALSLEAVVALVVLGLVCTALAFVVMAMLVADVGPGRALVITYVNPVVAVALGVVVLGERPGPGALVGLALILAGSWLSTRSSRLSVPRPIRQPS